MAGGWWTTMYQFDAIEYCKRCFTSNFKKKMTASMVFDGDNEAAVAFSINPIRNLINEYETCFNVTQRRERREK